MPNDVPQDAYEQSMAEDERAASVGQTVAQQDEVAAESGQDFTERDVDQNSGELLQDELDEAETEQKNQPIEISQLAPVLDAVQAANDQSQQAQNEEDWAEDPATAPPEDEPIGKVKLATQIIQLGFPTKGYGYKTLLIDLINQSASYSTDDEPSVETPGQMHILLEDVHWPAIETRSG